MLFLYSYLLLLRVEAIYVYLKFKLIAQEEQLNRLWCFNHCFCISSKMYN